MLYCCWSCYTVVIVGGLVDVILLKVLLILGLVDIVLLWLLVLMLYCCWWWSCGWYIIAGGGLVDILFFGLVDVMLWLLVSCYIVDGLIDMLLVLLTLRCGCWSC